MNKYFRETLPKSHVINIFHKIGFFLVRNLRKSQHFHHFRRFSQKYEIDFLRNILLQSKNPNFRIQSYLHPTLLLRPGQHGQK
jgi:hypothetical protein